VTFAILVLVLVQTAIDVAVVGYGVSLVRRVKHVANPGGRVGERDA
jgi:hypothetical protein